MNAAPTRRDFIRAAALAGAAATALTVTAADDPADTPSPLPLPKPTPPAPLVRLTVPDDAAFPAFRRGDVLECRPVAVADLRAGTFVYLVLDDGEPGDPLHVIGAVDLNDTDPPPHANRGCLCLRGPGLTLVDYSEITAAFVVVAYVRPVPAPDPDDAGAGEDDLPAVAFDDVGGRPVPAFPCRRPHDPRYDAGRNVAWFDLPGAARRFGRPAGELLALWSAAWDARAEGGEL